jgi:phage baseplate assembly protein W
MDHGDFRGTGWRFPIIPQAGGALGYIDGDDGVAASVELLLRTFTRERVMRPEFGVAVLDLVFEPGSEQNLFAVEQAVREAVVRWEPRVEIETLRATLRGTDVEVDLRYRVLRTNTVRNLTFPYYRTSGGVVES